MDLVNPVLTFTAPPEWLVLSDVTAHTDLEGWARTHADALVARGQAAGVDPRALTTYLTTVGRHYLKDPGLGCFLLVPPTGTTVAGLVRVERHDGPRDAEELAARVAGFVPPDDWCVEPARVDDVSTPAGTATRIVVRAAPPGEDGAVVGESLTYLWWFPEEQQSVVATLLMDDLVVAGRWRDSTDALLSSARRTDSGAASAEPSQGRAVHA